MQRSLCHVTLWALLGWSVRAEQDLDLILYGADGCVGHFAASHLAQQSGLRWAIAGRTEAHLLELVDELAKEGGYFAKPEVIVASLDGKVDPKTWVTRAKAVISAAGPFSAHGGELVVRACAESGVNYADTSDEFYWQRRMVDGYDAAAQKSGAKVVLATGFCVLAGDLGSQLALGGLGAAHGSDEASLGAWLETYNGGLSAGVLNTMHAMNNASYPKEWNIDPYVLAPQADVALRVDTEVEGMRYPSYVSGEGLVVPNIFGPYDARLLRRTFTQLGQKVHLRVGASSGMYPRWTAFLAEHPGSWSQLAKCPSPTLYKDGAWAYRFKASRNGRSHTVLLSGSGDPGYRFTALGLAETGLCLAGRTPGCLKDGSHGGVYTTMSTMDAAGFLNRLKSVDLIKAETWSSEDEAEIVV